MKFNPKLIFSIIFLAGLSVISLNGADPNTSLAQLGGGGNPGGGQQPQGSLPMSGFAWGASEDDANPLGGVGWISFSCEDSGTCNDVNYGVYVDNNTGFVHGQAWSSNYGWLSFESDDVTPFCNTVSNGVPQQVRIEDWGIAQPPYKFVGVARFLSFDTDNANPDYWNGCVNFSGFGGVQHEVSMSADGELFGWAWGGNNTGWISFECDECNVSVEFPPDPDAIQVTFYADPNVIPVGTHTNLYWEAQNVTGCYPAGNDNGYNHWTGPNSPLVPFPLNLPNGVHPTNSINNSNTIDEDTIYTLRCRDLNNVEHDFTALVQIEDDQNQPTLQLLATPSTYAVVPNPDPDQYPVQLTWTKQPASTDFTSCSAKFRNSLFTASINLPGWSGNQPVPNAQTQPISSPDAVMIPPNLADPGQTYIFIIECELVGGGSLVAEDTIQFTEPGQVVSWIDLQLVTPSSGVLASNGGDVTINLVTQNISVCHGAPSVGPESFEYTNGNLTGSNGEWNSWQADNNGDQWNSNTVVLVPTRFELTCLGDDGNLHSDDVCVGVDGQIDPLGCSPDGGPIIPIFEEF